MYLTESYYRQFQKGEQRFWALVHKDQQRGVRAILILPLLKRGSGKLSGAVIPRALAAVG